MRQGLLVNVTCCSVAASDLVKMDGRGPRGKTDPEPGSLGPRGQGEGGGEWVCVEDGVGEEARRGCTWDEDETRLLAQDGGFFLEEVGQRVEAR